MTTTTKKQSVYQMVCQALKENDWTFAEHPEDLVVTTGAKGEKMPIPLIILVQRSMNTLSIYSELPFAVPEAVRERVAVAINLINYTIVNGCFDYNYSEGKIVFRIAQYVGESGITPNDIHHLIVTASVTVDRFNHRIFDITNAAKMSLNEMTELLNKA